MDHQELGSRSGRYASRIFRFALVFAGMAALGVYWKDLSQIKIGFEPWFEALRNIQKKVHSLQIADQERDRLRMENTYLRVRLEERQFDCHEAKSQKLTIELGRKLSQETGSQVGRTLANIRYKIPEHLLPSQLHTLGASYFKGHEYEKAAVIFTFLTGLEDDPVYKTAKDFLLGGVSWYRLDNLALADFYFDQVLKAQETQENLPYLAQARLWKGLVSERLGKHLKSQHWLLELVDHHPHSTEAVWVNSREREEERAKTAVE